MMETKDLDITHDVGKEAETQGDYAISDWSHELEVIRIVFVHEVSENTILTRQKRS